MADLTPNRLLPGDADLGLILPLLHTCFAYMENRIDPPSSLHRLTAAEITDQARDQEIWTIGSPPLACMFLTQKPDCLYLGKLAVAPDHRGKGLARVLIDLAQGRVSKLGQNVLELETRIEMVENHGFFRKLGFVETGQSAHAGYDRPTSITFRKEIP